MRQCDLRFAIVRNPYRRLISAWRNKALICEPGYERVHENARTFAQFLEFLEDLDLSTCNPHWRRQTDLLFSGAIPYTYIGRIEELSTTETLLGQHIKKPVKFTNGNSGLNIGDPSLNERIARRIQLLYTSDFSTIEYSPDSWRDIKERPLSQEQVLDEIIERNRMISLLYDQCAELKWRADHPVSTVLKRLMDLSQAAFLESLQARQESFRIRSERARNSRKNAPVGCDVPLFEPRSQAPDYRNFADSRPKPKR